MPPKPRSDDKEQAAAFRKAVREVGAKASDEEFQDVLRKVGKHKSPAQKEGAKERINKRRG